MLYLKNWRISFVYRGKKQMKNDNFFIHYAISAPLYA